MTIKKTPKAKSQKTVSRAVKEAGFKNIKEAKETLHKYKEELANNCCGTSKCENCCGTCSCETEKNIVKALSDTAKVLYNTANPTTVEQLQRVIEIQQKRILLLEKLVIARTQLLNEKSSLIEDYKWNEYYTDLEKEEAIKKAQPEVTGFLQQTGETKKASWLPIQALHNDTPVTIRVWAVL